ncbi:MAG: CerR family C-terminal domain-containing protein [Geobacteraceae bacterium]|nr:CerR family C-terminal domain-containing protein [Geobacteraceae bacterium]
MAKQKAGDTREKLLSAACDVFVEMGFRDATVAEICRRAGANISAVNYHFGSKETLYQQAWRHSFAESVRIHPQDGGVSEDAPARERLQGRLKALIERIADKNNRDFFISQMEFVNPTGLLEEVMRTEFIPLRKKTLSLMRELLGPDASEEEVVFCESCIISMCVHPMLLRRISQKTGNTGGPHPPFNLEAYTKHVVKFALAGIAAIKGGEIPGTALSPSVGDRP